jgi:hypothetical protein
MSGWVAGATVVAGLAGASASRSAAKTQAAAADRATDVQQQMFERQAELQEPWRQAGMTALNKLIPMATEYTPFGMQQFQQDPGYAFRLSEGMKALERSAAARGGLLSGATMKGLQRYGQDLASQEYGNAFNRYQAERAAALNPLQSLAGMGQTTAAQLGQAGMMAGQNMGQTMMGAGAARASGYVGQANALNQALGTGLNFYQGQNYLDVLRERNRGGGGGGYSAPISAATPVEMPYYGVY